MFAVPCPPFPLMMAWYRLFFRGERVEETGLFLNRDWWEGGPLDFPPLPVIRVGESESDSVWCVRRSDGIWSWSAR